MQLNVNASGHGVIETEKNLVLTPNSGTGQVILPLNNDATAPTLAFGDGDTGLYQPLDNQIGVAIGGNASWLFSGSSFQSTDSLGGLSEPKRSYKHIPCTYIQE